MRAIFISYRRSDAEGEAGRLFDDLVKHFGENTVFMDVSAIEAGRDFRQAIDESIAGCGVVLVVIGPQWLEAKDAAETRRLDDPADFVRIETASALRRDIPVIPLLVRGAKMPRGEQLPDELKDLAYRNCVELTHVRWRSDIQLLFNALRPLLRDPKSSPSRTGSHPAAIDPGHATKPAEFIHENISGIDAAAQQRIAGQLARYIGPIAEVVVKRSAPHCTSADDLCLQVAQEIESPAERQKFLAAVRG